MILELSRKVRSCFPTRISRYLVVSARREGGREALLREGRVDTRAHPDGLVAIVRSSADIRQDEANQGPLCPSSRSAHERPTIAAARE